MIKSINIICILLLVLAVSSCKEEPTNNLEMGYASTADFFLANASPMQIYNVDGSAGGIYTTPKGTVITIPADAFVNQNGDSVFGNVLINFKDVYKKSDMMLNLLSTNLYSSGAPMKSAGMFYFKAVQGMEILGLRPGKSITVAQPLKGLPIDTAMRPYWLMTDGGLSGWFPINGNGSGDPLTYTDSNYIFTLYEFFGSGTWYNCDNQHVFAAFPQTTLTLCPPSDFSVNSIVTYLFFSDINATVTVYSNGTNFIYNYAPVGLECTAIAIAIKDQKIYTSFTPITIGANMSVNYLFSETTEADFLAQLNSLN